MKGPLSSIFKLRNAPNHTSSFLIGDYALEDFKELTLRDLTVGVLVDGRSKFLNVGIRDSLGIADLGVGVVEELPNLSEVQRIILILVVLAEDSVDGGLELWL